VNRDPKDRNTGLILCSFNSVSTRIWIRDSVGNKVCLEASVADPGSGAFLTPGSGIRDG
jgi:hypothetical protein